jgi:hypothetical protein
MVMEWAAAVGGFVVAVAGLAFSWFTSRRGEAQTAALARANNEHSRALTDLTYAHSRSLELMRYEQQEQEQRRLRSAEAYLEIAEIVIRAARNVEAPSEERSAHDDGLTRALALVLLYAGPTVKGAFEGWYDRYQKVVFAVDRLHEAREREESDTLWRPQVRDGRLREADARERLLTAMARHLAPETARPASPGGQPEVVPPPQE